MEKNFLENSNDEETIEMLLKLSDKASPGPISTSMLYNGTKLKKDQKI